MTPRNAFWKWSLIGGLGAVILLVTQSWSVGGLEGLPQVGEHSDLRPLIEAELGEIPLAPFRGHDGQVFYAISMDLSGERVPESLLHPGYRYRRILFPAVASGFGILGGSDVVVGMAVTVAISTAVAAGSVAAAARVFDRSDWIALAVILNPGVWLSVRLLTADVVAIGLMSLGIFGYLTRPRLGIAAFSVSVLAKEPYLLTPAGLSLSRDRQRWQFTLMPVVALLLWAGWVAMTIGSELSGESGNLTLPFFGIVKASGWWPNLSPEDLGYLGFALVSTLAALVLGVFQKGWLRWSLLCWGILGVSASAWVWRVGNNSARAAAPIAVLVVLGLAANGRNVRPGHGIRAEARTARAPTER